MARGPSTANCCPALLPKQCGGRCAPQALAPLLQRRGHFDRETSATLTGTWGGDHRSLVGSFASDIAVEPVSPGRYRASLDHSWDLLPLPQGGVVASFALRAAGHEV